MKFTKLNIDSTKPFYMDKLGNIYNQDYKKLNCSKINGSHFLSFVLNDDSRKACKESIARLIYQTHFPKRNIENCNIFKKKLDIENPYQIDNLKKVLKKNMPKQNKLPAIQANKKNPIKRKFYEKLSKSQLNILIVLAASKNMKSITLAKLYSVNRNTMLKHRNNLSKMKPLKI